MYKRRISLILVCVMLLGVLSACSSGGGGGDDAKGETLDITLGFTASEASTWNKGLEKFVELVDEASDGKIKVSIYPNEQLSGGNQSKSIEMLQNGTMDMSLHSNIIYSVMDDRFGVVSLPFLFDGYDDVDKKVRDMDSPGAKALLEVLDDVNVKGLAFAENGFRQITNSKKAIESPADMKGMKIRVPGIQMYISLFQELSCDPISMNFGEVFTSLQQGAIDGQENPLDIIASSKIYEVQEYLTMCDYSYDMTFLGMNKDLWESLTEEQQEIIQVAAIEAMDYQVELNRSKDEEHIKTFEEAGVNVNYLSDEAVAEFKEVLEPIYQQYEDVMGKELIEAFRD